MPFLIRENNAFVGFDFISSSGIRVVKKKMEIWNYYRTSYSIQQVFDVYKKNNKIMYIFPNPNVPNLSLSLSSLIRLSYEIK